MVFTASIFTATSFFANYFPSEKDLVTVLCKADSFRPFFFIIAHSGCFPWTKAFVKSTIYPPKISWAVETQIMLVPANFASYTVMKK